MLQCTECKNYEMHLAGEDTCKLNDFSFTLKTGADICSNYQAKNEECDVFYVDEDGIPHYENIN